MNSLVLSRVPLLGVLLFGLMACVTVPKDYVPDQKVVFLMQNTDFGPISYPALAADPYVFLPSTAAVDAEHPAFLQVTAFNTYLKADLKADSFLYRSARAHFESILSLPLIAQLRIQLDQAQIQPPAALAPDHGDKVQDYTNGTQYQYPGSPNSLITILNSGTYIINFEDRSLFQADADGTLLWKDAQGNQTQYFNPKNRSVGIQLGDTLFESTPVSRRLRGPQGTMEFMKAPQPQYRFTALAKGALPYVLFLDDSGGILACSVATLSGLRYDWFPEDKSLLITQGSQAISLRDDFQKAHATFNADTRKPGELLSLFLPQGVRLTNLTGKTPSWGELTPAWPEGYVSKPMGPFDVWYTPKDQGLLANLKVDKLVGLEAKDRSLTGLGTSARHAVVIPPDLAAYRKLHASKPGEVLHWYPSGFETLDYIILWPFSVPRYDQPAGQDYFYNQEIYEILAHEYVHALVGENSGIVHPVPVWLNEGLAVYTECQLFPDAKKYWETTLTVARDQGRFLPWDDVTVKGTGEYPVAQARTHYAQSYGLVKALMGHFGAAKVDAYIQSFRAIPGDEGNKALIPGYQTNFLAVFGVSWTKALDLMKPEPAKS